MAGFGARRRVFFSADGASFGGGKTRKKRKSETFDPKKHGIIIHRQKYGKFSIIFTENGLIAVSEAGIVGAVPDKMKKELGAMAIRVDPKKEWEFF